MVELRTNQIKYLISFFIFCLSIVAIYYVFFYIFSTNTQNKVLSRAEPIVEELDRKNIDVVDMEQNLVVDNYDTDDINDVNSEDLEGRKEIENISNTGSSIQERYYSMLSNKQNFCVNLVAKEVVEIVKETLQEGKGNNFLAGNPELKNTQSTRVNDSSQQNIVEEDFSFKDSKKIDYVNNEHKKEKVLPDICAINTQKEEIVSPGEYEKKSETYFFSFLSSIRKILTSFFDSSLQAVFVCLSLLFVLFPENPVGDRELLQKKKNQMKKKSSERNAKVSESLFQKKDDVFPSDKFPKEMGSSEYNPLLSGFSSSSIRSPEFTRSVYPTNSFAGGLKPNVNSPKNSLSNQLVEIESDEEIFDEEKKQFFQAENTPSRINEIFQFNSHESVRQSVARRSMVFSIDGRPNRNISVSNFRAPNTLQSRTTSSITEVSSLEEIAAHIYFTFQFEQTRAEYIRSIICSFLERWESENSLNLPFDSNREEFIDAILESEQGLTLFFSYVIFFGQALQGTEYQRLTEETQKMLEDLFSSGYNQIFNSFFRFVQTRTDSMTIEDANSNLAQNIFQLFSAMVPRFFKIYNGQGERLQMDNIDAKLSEEEIDYTRSILTDIFFFFLHLDLLYKKDLAGTELKKIF